MRWNQAAVERNKQKARTASFRDPNGSPPSWHLDVKPFPHPEVKKHKLGIRVVLEHQETFRWKRKGTQRKYGVSRGGREPALTFLLLSSHFLFFSGAEEGEDTAIASLASIGATHA